jgi:isopenicillin N synthase-like dioxygenase
MLVLHGCRVSDEFVRERVRTFPAKIGRYWSISTGETQSKARFRLGRNGIPGVVTMNEQLMLRNSETLSLVELPGEGVAWTSDAGRDAAKAINAACGEFGYFFLTNHGIPADKIAFVIEEAREFYGRPLAEKASYQSSAKSQFLGYRGLGAERSLSHSGAEACEQFRIGNVLSTEPHLRAADWDFFHRPFPKSVALLADMTRVGNCLMAAGAVGLGQEPILFDQFLDQPMHRLGLNLYETGAGARIGNTVNYAMSSHVDHAVFTIVAQDVPGLEVLSPDGEWVDVPIISDALFVFLGDYFQRWTNGRFRAVPHRVREIRKDRISIQYKHKPSYATIVAPLAQFVSESDPARYEPFDTGHQYEQLMNTLLTERQIN